jgi:hypothetical protein
MIFGLFKKAAPRKPPPLTSEAIQPVDKPVSLADAKRVFRAYTVAHGILDTREVADHVGYMVDDIKSHEESLREEAEQYKPEVADAKDALKEALRDSKTAKTPEEKEAAEDEVESCREALDDAQRVYERAAKELADFKADKRQFLIEYVNRQFQRD